MFFRKHLGQIGGGDGLGVLVGIALPSYTGKLDADTRIAFDHFLCSNQHAATIFAAKVTAVRDHCHHESENQPAVAAGVPAQYLLEPLSTRSRSWRATESASILHESCEKAGLSYIVGTSDSV